MRAAISASNPPADRCTPRWIGLCQRSRSVIVGIMTAVAATGAGYPKSGSNARCRGIWQTPAARRACSRARARERRAVVGRPARRIGGTDRGREALKGAPRGGLSRAMHWYRGTPAARRACSRARARERPAVVGRPARRIGGTDRGREALKGAPRGGLSGAMHWYREHARRAAGVLPGVRPGAPGSNRLPGMAHGWDAPHQSATLGHLATGRRPGPAGRCQGRVGARLTGRQPPTAMRVRRRRRPDRAHRTPASGNTWRQRPDPADIGLPLGVSTTRSRRAHRAG
jgi:hypothetical protein